MKNKHPTPGWALLAMVGCALGVLVLFTGLACQQPAGGGGEDGEPPAECDPPCAEGETCEDGVCVAAPAECDPPCADGETCEDGVCVAAPAECDPPCADGEVCTDGECVAAPADVCDPACAEDEVCVDGECMVADPFGGESVLAGFADGGPLHDFAQGGHAEGFDGACDDCHHAEPNASAQACSACHGDDAAFNEDLGLLVPSFKDLGHAGKPGDDTTGNTACADCHQETTEDGLWDCSQCHTGF